MKKLNFAFSLLLWVGCTNAQNESLVVAFNLPTSDQLQATSSGICTCTPQSQAQATYRPTGFLEVNPALNPAAEYTLNLQTENYLDVTQFSDYNGTTISAQQRNDFHVDRAVVNYLDTGGLLPAVAPVTVLVSADVRPGGLQASSCVPIQAVPHSIASLWAPALETDGGTNSDVVVLEVQLFGTLSSGESINTGLFHFPLTICSDCAGALPCNGPNQTKVGVGHGPCCEFSDFVVFCETCGGQGQPCCGNARTCNSGDAGLTCQPVTSTSAEFCAPYNNGEAFSCQKSTSG
jgi:hypothetical protein